MILKHITSPQRAGTPDRIAAGRRPCLLVIALAGLASAWAPAGSVVADDEHQTFFAEPTSGRKVTHYQIELPVGRNERATFSIPDDCTEVMRTLGGGTIHRGNIIDRHLWKKTENDCRYNAFLHRHPQRVIEDHVSDYDFRNARLHHLPLDRRCAASGPDSDAAGCAPTSTDGFGMLRHFPIATPVSDIPPMADCIPCRLRNGRFRGYVLVDREGVRCQTDASAPGVRLIAVDFADINGDRVLDAVLRFIAIGPGNNRAPLVLPLTRLDASAPFSVPSPMHLPPLESR